jgi:transcriptional regulator with XRE-family HTH domain
MASDITYEYSSAFSTNLKSLMEANGLTGKALSDLTSIPDPTIYRYLSMARAPRMEYVVTIARFFNVSLDWLLGLSDNKYPSLTSQERRLLLKYNRASFEDRQVVDVVLDKYNVDE